MMMMNGLANPKYLLIFAIVT